MNLATKEFLATALVFAADQNPDELEGKTIFDYSAEAVGQAEIMVTVFYGIAEKTKIFNTDEDIGMSAFLQFAGYDSSCGPYADAILDKLTYKLPTNVVVGDDGQLFLE